MILVQDTFYAKYGRGDELVQLFKEMREVEPSFANTRLLTDASGRFFQVITHMEVESLAAWEALFAAEMSREDFGNWFARMMDATDHGSREFFNIVE